MLTQSDQPDITRRLASMALARTRPAPAAEERPSSRVVTDARGAAA